MATATATAPDSEIKIKIGKMIFYITCAIGLWFFYWFAGIQCPCLTARAAKALFSHLPLVTELRRR